MKTNTLFDRMSPKSLSGLMASHFQQQYSLSPQAAQTICRDVLLIRNVFERSSRAEGQIIYYAVKLGEPPSKRIRDCELLSVKLTLHDPADLDYRKRHGQKALIQYVIQRICREAYEQGAVLSIEDVAMVLHISERTVKRYKQEIGQAGTPLILRGSTADMGPSTCHRAPIVELFLQGYSETVIARRTNHALRVAILLADGYAPGVVTRITRLSKGKVQTIQALYERLSHDPFYQEALLKVLEIYRLRRRFKKKGGPQ
jgi:AraC-like DNA-binding protein